MIPNEARDHGDVSDDDSTAEIENDLTTLAAMDLSLWSDFRSSFAVPDKRLSLESLFLKSQTISTRNLSSLTGGIGIDEDDFDDSEENDTFEDSGSGSSGYHVSFSSLTPGEQRDIRAWNIRLSRETVFSRYYFPEIWEQRELKAIANFLDLNDNEARCLYVSCIQQYSCTC
jgi:hypothetical protein